MKTNIRPVSGLSPKCRNFFFLWNWSNADATAKGGSYVGGVRGHAPPENFENKEQNSAIWGYLGGFYYT